jgi:hypothetical protein
MFVEVADKPSDRLFDDRLAGVHPLFRMQQDRIVRDFGRA